MSRFLVDVVHAWRAVRHRPAATGGIVLILAIGIGLATCMFAMVDPFLWRPLPYAHPDDLVVISAHLEDAPERRVLTIAELRARRDLFQSAAAFRTSEGLRLRLPGGTAWLRTADVVGPFFDVLGVSVPLHVEAPASGGAASIVVTDKAFARWFWRRTEWVGRAFDIPNGAAARLTGILPASFVFPSDTGLFPYEAIRILPEGPGGGDGADTPALGPFRVVARLRGGVTVGTVRAALAAALGVKSRAVSVDRVVTLLTADNRRLAYGAFAAALLLLLVCGGNVANLVLARAAARTDEFALRAALGASRADLSRLLFCELVFISLFALGAGLLFARFAVGAAGQVIPFDYATLGEPGLTARGVWFSSAAAALFVLLGTLASRTRRFVMNPGRMLLSETRAIRATRFVTIAAQSALSTLLVVGGLFLARSYVRLVGQEAGLRADVVAITVLYPDNEAGLGMRNEIDRSIAAVHRIRSVTGVAAAIGSMIDRSIYFGAVRLRGVSVSACQKYVTPGYFDVVGSPIVRGRRLTAQDTGASAVMVNEAFAARYLTGAWPDQRVEAVSGTAIVGVVHDTFDVALDRRPQPAVYRLIENPSGCRRDCNRVTYVVRMVNGNLLPETDIRRTFSRLNPDAVVLDTTTIGGRLAGSIRHRSFVAVVLGLFASTSVAVCLAGLVSIVSFTVRRRTSEIAIRMSLGAQPVPVIVGVVRGVIGAGSAGIVVGLIAGRWASLAAQHLLYGTAPGDPVTLGIATAIMLALTALVSFLAALPALSVSPVVALRER